MAKFKNVSLVFMLVICFCSCSSSSMRIMATWVDPNVKPAPQPGKHKIFLFVLAQNYEAQVYLENDLASAAASKGILTVKSIDAFGPILTPDKLPKTEVLLKAIRDQGCDFIFTVSLVDQSEKTHYVQSSYSAGFVPYAGYGYSYSGYYAYSPAFYSPGYYTTDKTYFIESNLFSTETEKMLISMQSKVENPPAIEKASKQYTKMLMTELQARGFVKD